MAHLIEEYALSCGLKINRPELYEAFFPIPFEKFILIHAGGAMPAKLYEYYSEVVQLIREPLTKAGYEIVQIGGQEDPRIANVVSLNGITNIHQTAYLIRNASLLLGNDSCNAHIASGLDTPLVALYGPTTVENHGPYFSSPGKAITLVADLEGKKPSFAPQEYPKTINRVKAEDVAQSVLDLLGIDYKINFKTIYAGLKFNSGGVDLVPNCVLPPQIAQNVIPQIRMDYLFDEEGLVANLRVRKQIIVTDRPINIEILKAFKPNILNILFEVKDDSTNEFISEVKKIGIPYTLYSKLSGQELGKSKLDFFDFGVILELRYGFVKELSENTLVNEKTQFKTNKFVVASNKIYLSKSHLKKEISTTSFGENTGYVILDDPEFLEGAEYYYLFNT